MQQSTVKLLNSINMGTLISISGVACISVLILIILKKHLGKTIKQYILDLEINWVAVWLPLLFVSALFSYFSWSTVNPTVSALLFLTAIAIFLVQSKVLMSAYEAIRLRQNEEAFTLQMDMQKNDYESV